MTATGKLARQAADVRELTAVRVPGRHIADAGARILVCDSDPQSRQALRVVLGQAGFEVDTTRNAAEALDRSAIRVPTAAILELLLPDGDGVEVCRRLREWSSMPVLMLSAVSDEEQQVRAFDAGADDYLTKPFRPRELVARVQTKLRRADGVPEKPAVMLGGLEVDLAAHAVRRDGCEIHLAPMEFRLLRVLLSNRGRLLTQNMLLQQVWGPAYVDGRQTLRSHIATLRRKIEPAHGPRLIHTEPRVGYRFVDIQLEHPNHERPTGRVTSKASRLHPSLKPTFEVSSVLGTGSSRSRRPPRTPKLRGMNIGCATVRDRARRSTVKASNR